MEPNRYRETTRWPGRTRYDRGDVAGKIVLTVCTRLRLPGLHVESTWTASDLDPSGRARGRRGA